MEQSRVDEIYRVIEGLSIELDPDPTVLGARYIMDRVAKCRNNLNRVLLIRQKISQERRELKRQLSGEEAIFAVEKDELLASNEVVKQQPSIRDREAVVNTFLRDRLNRISQLKADILDLDTVEQPVRMVHEELTRTSTEIRTQRSMIQADRVSGAAYGDESSGAPESIAPEMEDIGEEELDRIMREQLNPVVPEIPEELEVPVEEPPVVEPPVLVEEPPVVEPPAPVGDSITTESVAIPMEVPEEPPTSPDANLVEPSTPESSAEEDPDIAKFLSATTSEEKAPKSAKKTKARAAKDEPQGNSTDAGQIDFEDLLKSI